MPFQDRPDFLDGVFRRHRCRVGPVKHVSLVPKHDGNTGPASFPDGPSEIFEHRLNGRPLNVRACRPLKKWRRAFSHVGLPFNKISTILQYYQVQKLRARENRVAAANQSVRRLISLAHVGDRGADEVLEHFGVRVFEAG